MSGAAELGYQEMDSVHAEFDALLAHATTCADEELSQVLAGLVTHMVDHFEMEDGWMQQGEFPPRDCHTAEHAAVLASAAQVRPLVAQGDIQVGRAFVRALVDWFPNHATYLDSALAAWMCKRQLGARPLVFQRHVASH
jgi:hemerythrin